MLRVEPTAEAEVDTAVTWYDSQNPALVDAFLEAWVEALASVESMPSSFPLMEECETEDVRN